MAKTIDVRCDKTGVIFDVSTKRIFVEDVKTLTNGQIAVLECGDFVVKQTGNQKHTYKVTYKEENVGLCITYEDATLIETVSYDWNGEKWVYNSTDTATLDGGGSSPSEAKKYYKHKIILQCPNVDYDEENPTDNLDYIGVEVLTSQSTQLSIETLQSLLDEWLEKNAYQNTNSPYIFNVTYAMVGNTYFELVAPNPDGICYSHTPNIDYNNNECRTIYDIERYSIVEL